MQSLTREPVILSEGVTNTGHLGEVSVNQFTSGLTDQAATLYTL